MASLINICPLISSDFGIMGSVVFCSGQSNRHGTRSSFKAHPLHSKQAVLPLFPNSCPLYLVGLFYTHQFQKKDQGVMKNQLGPLPKTPSFRIWETF